MEQMPEFKFVLLFTLTQNEQEARQPKSPMEQGSNKGINSSSLGNKHSDKHMEYAYQ